jgi:DNA-binding response OmpR family regulator
VEGKGTGRPDANAPKSLFIIERDERLQEALREKFKEKGYRVLLAADPERALDRLRQTPVDALIVDARTTGEEGLQVFEVVLSEASQKQVPCAGVLLLTDEQAEEWKTRIKIPKTGGVLVGRSTSFKQLSEKLRGLIATSVA